jgi:predicted AlkP superfamily phosphohydrolase/phosphomutase
LNGIYLNRMGRETEGIVEPGPAGDAVLKGLGDRVMDFRDPKTGERVVETVYQSRDVFHGEAWEYAPDLIVGYRPGYRASWQTALGGVPEEIIEDNVEAWIGDHCIAEKYVPGALLSSRPMRAAHLRLYDVTATILAEFGVRPAPGMLGESIF